MMTIDNKPKDTGLAAALILMLITWFTADTLWVMPAIVALILTMTVPVVFKPLSVVWFGLADRLGHVVSTVILTLLFFAVLMPIGVIRRAFGADALGLKKWKNGNESVFVVRDHLFLAGDLEKPY